MSISKYFKLQPLPFENSAAVDSESSWLIKAVMLITFDDHV